MGQNLLILKVLWSTGLRAEINSCWYTVFLQLISHTSVTSALLRATAFVYEPEKTKTIIQQEHLIDTHWFHKARKWTWFFIYSSTGGETKQAIEKYICFTKAYRSLKDSTNSVYSLDFKDCLVPSAQEVLEIQDILR